MKSFIIKINYYINPQQIPIPLFILALPQFFIIKNQEIKIIKDYDGEILLKFIKIKYFYLMLFVYLTYTIISVLANVFEKEKTKNKNINITYLIYIILMFISLSLTIHIYNIY
jgi:hypothetical protein